MRDTRSGIAVIGLSAVLLVTALTFARPEPASPAPAQPRVSADTIELDDSNNPHADADLYRAHPTDIPLAPDSDAPARTLRWTGDIDAGQRALGVTWGEQGSASVAVRFLTADGWTTWRAAGMTHERDGAGRAGTDLFFTEPATRADVAVTQLGMAPLRRPQIHLIDPGEDPVAPADAPAPDNDIYYYSRASWGADESLMTWDVGYADGVNAVVVHHTVNSNDYAAEDVPAMMRSIYYFHSVTRGWGDIGYNLVVDRFGRAWEARAGGLWNAVIGGHAIGFNVGTAGVSLLGTYTDTAPPAEALETISRFVAAKLPGIDPRSSVNLHGGPSDKIGYRGDQYVPRVFGHRVTSATSCPGDQLDAAIPAIAERASTLGHVGFRPL